MLKLHDLDGDQVLTGLRLRVLLVASDEEKSSIHHSRTSQHGGHEGIVTGAVHEGDVSLQHELSGAALIRALDNITLG